MGVRGVSGSLERGREGVVHYVVPPP